MDIVTQELLNSNQFTPREIMSRYNGAWYEPGLNGTCFTTNTGEVAASSGSTVGLALDRTQNQTAETSIVSNGTFIDTSAWVSNPAVTRASLSVSNNIGTITCVDSTGRMNQPVTTEIGALYKITATQNNGTSTPIFRVGNSIYDSSGTALYNSSTTGTITAYFIASATTTYVILICAGTAGTNALFSNIAIQKVSGHHATQATAANRPTLQISGNTAFLRHDSNDYLTASLPSINVRRNLLTYSEQFDNAAWTKTSGTITADSNLSPFGNPTADWLVQTSGQTTLAVISDSSRTYTSGQAYTVSVYVKQINKNFFRFQEDVSVGSAVNTFVSLVDGSVGTKASAHTVTVRSAPNGYWRIAVTFTPDATRSGNFALAHADTNNSITVTDSGSTVFFGAQLETGSVATSYQKVTDWTSEAYSSSGSVYFATPSGMSAQHNQSMGATYNLPAYNSDIYGYVLVPERLSSMYEEKLSRYFNRLTGINDSDFFWQELATDGLTGQLLTDNGIILTRG